MLAIVLRRSNNVEKEKRKNHLLRRQFHNQRYVERDAQRTERTAETATPPIHVERKMDHLLDRRQNDDYAYVRRFADYPRFIRSDDAGDGKLVRHDTAFLGEGRFSFLESWGVVFLTWR